MPTANPLQQIIDKPDLANVKEKLQIDRFRRDSALMLFWKIFCTKPAARDNLFNLQNNETWCTKNPSPSFVLSTFICKGLMFFFFFLQQISCEVIYTVFIKLDQEKTLGEKVPLVLQWDFFSTFFSWCFVCPTPSKDGTIKTTWRTSTVSAFQQHDPQ